MNEKLEYNKKIKIGEISNCSLFREMTRENNVTSQIANKGITLISLAISRKCVWYEKRTWKPCERRENKKQI